MSSRTSPQNIGSLTQSTRKNGNLTQGNSSDVILFEVITPINLEILASRYLAFGSSGVLLSVAKDLDNDSQLDSNEIFSQQSLPSTDTNVSIFEQNLNNGRYFIEYKATAGNSYQVYYYSNLVVSGGGFGGTPNAVTDFNKDGNTDILMSNASQGWSGFYTMNGTTASSWVSLPYSSGAVATGAGDFNKDGNTDILMSNASQGWSGFYTMNGTTASSWVSLPYAGGAVATGAGDFNKDGNTDILMSNASQGWSGFYTMNGTTASSWVSLPYSSGAVAM